MIEIVDSIEFIYTLYTYEYLKNKNNRVEILTKF